MTICHAKQEDEKELVFKFGFIEQFEPIGNLLCDPELARSSSRHPPSAGATFPQGKASTRKWELSLITKTMFFFWLQRKEGFPHTLAFP